MKAKIKATGEIVELNEQGIPLFENEQGIPLFENERGIYKDVNGNKYRGNELEFIKENPEKDIDWEQRRYEIAKEVFASIYDFTIDRLNFAKYSVDAADALIAELKKGDGK